jgi:hypothetical protein
VESPGAEPVPSPPDVPGTPTGSPEPPGPAGPEAVRTPPGANLPAPILSEPFAIGEALYDPSRVDVAVVSLLALMGVGIYRPDGTALRAGDEHQAGDPWLFDVEVRDLIDRSVEELAAGLEDGGGQLPLSMADLHAQVAPLVPALDARSLTRAYAEAYERHPDDLVPQVLLGQPVDDSFRMTTAQAWLLLVDGFVGPAAPRSAAIVPGSDLAAGGPVWGTARASIGEPVVTLRSLERDDFLELLGHLPTLASLIGFDVVQSAVHEGHGGPGARARIVAWIGPSVPLVSPVSGHRLLEQVNGDQGEPLGMEVRWETIDPDTLQRHGALDRSLPAITPSDAGGEATVHYDPRREPADGDGLEGEDYASLYASVDKRNLVEAFYVSNDPWVQQALLNSPVLGGRVLSSSRGFAIGFHAPGIRLVLDNAYQVTVGVGIGMDAQAHRIGTDRAEGLLTRFPDGTYRGVLRAHVNTTTDMTLTLPLAAGECHDRTNAAQALWVVGRPEPGRGLTDRDELVEGEAGGEDLALSFYPLEPPGSIGACDATIPFTGPRVVDGQAIAAAYLPFNDLRWSQPGTGYRIHLPDLGRLVYDDTEQLVPQWEVESIWRVEVDRNG